MSKFNIADMLVRREIEDTDLMIVEDKIDTKQAAVEVMVFRSTACCSKYIALYRDLLLAAKWRFGYNFANCAVGNLLGEWAYS